MQFIEGDTLTEGRGTFLYMDPQTIKDEGYNETCDNYSFCCMAWEVLSGKWLPSVTLKELMNMAKLNKYRKQTFPKWIPLELRKVLATGFEEDLNKRACWDDITEALSKIFPKLHINITSRNIFSRRFY